MQPAEHDPLQFGLQDEALDSPDEDLPPTYGTDLHDVSATLLQREPATTADQHNPLTVSLHESSAPSAPVWQHYPQPPAASAFSPETSPAVAASGSGASNHPPVPDPADEQWMTEGHSASLQNGVVPPSAAAVGAAAMTLAAASGATAGPMQVGNPELRVVVHNPLKHTGPSGIPGLEEAYISYEVTTATSMPHFSAQRITVRRRFRDFVSLANLLPKLLHGSFLPARPDKNMIEARRMTDAFIEERRAALERYLNRLAAHPTAARSEALRVFLEADGNLRSNPQWRCLKPKVLTPIKATNRLVRTLVGARKTAPTPSEVVQPAAVGRDIYRMLHENVQQFKGSFKHSSLSAEEVALRDDTLLFEDTAGALHVALNRAEAWCRATAARAGLLAEIAVSLHALSSYEASYTHDDAADAATTQALASTAQAMESCSQVASAASTISSSTLQPLRDHHASTPNVLSALHGRERQLLTVMTLKHDLEDKNAKLSAAQLMPASQAKKVESLRTIVGQLEVSVAAAEAEYNRQLVRNKEELEALRGSRGHELTTMLGSLIALELKSEQQQAAIWQQLVRELPQPTLTTAYMAQKGFHIGPMS